MAFFFLIRLIIRGQVSAGMFTGLITSITEIYYLLVFMSQSFWGLIDDNKSIGFLYTFMKLPHDIHYKNFQCGDKISDQKTFDKKKAISFENVSFSYPNSEREVLKNISVKIESASHIALERKNYALENQVYKLKRGIELKNVSFSYPNSKKKALDTLNLLIRQGEAIALIGENGSRKTSLSKIILGLYEPCSGDVLWDGIKINSFDKAAIYKDVSFIGQRPVQYNFTLRENIAIAYLGSINDDKKIIRL